MWYIPAESNRFTGERIMKNVLHTRLMAASRSSVNQELKNLTKIVNTVLTAEMTIEGVAMITRTKTPKSTKTTIKKFATMIGNHEMRKGNRETASGEKKNLAETTTEVKKIIAMTEGTGDKFVILFENDLNVDD